MAFVQLTPEQWREEDGASKRLAFVNGVFPSKPVLRKLQPSSILLRNIDEKRHDHIKKTLATFTYRRDPFTRNDPFFLEHWKIPKLNEDVGLIADAVRATIKPPKMVELADGLFSGEIKTDMEWMLLVLRPKKPVSNDAPRSNIDHAEEGSGMPKSDREIAPNATPRELAKRAEKGEEPARAETAGGKEKDKTEEKRNQAPRADPSFQVVSLREDDDSRFACGQSTCSLIFFPRPPGFNSTTIVRDRKRRQRVTSVPAAVCGFAVPEPGPGEKEGQIVVPGG